jgi:hypothetical protein
VVNSRSLLVLLLLLALSGVVIHYRLHNFMVYDRTAPGGTRFDATRFIPFLFGLLDSVGVTLLFMSKRTALYGYLLNGFLVIYGTVMMVHFSFAQMADTTLSPGDWLIKSNLPYIGINWADFLAGKALYELYMRGG